mmetsp:Transcript_23194/g.52188  ORF Transcript_23194/g.52188 Transcript_23194/m.52188 type:complete len:277 (+) Transcript_23194:92-922(+)
MVLPPELHIYAENILRRFPEEFMVLGAPNLEEIYDLRPNGTWSRKMVESSAEKTIEITLRRWPTPAAAYPQAMMGGYMPVPMQAPAPWPAAMAAAARYPTGATAPSVPPVQSSAQGLDDQAAERLGRLENALLALKPQIEAIVAKQMQPQAPALSPMSNNLPRMQGESSYQATGDGKGGSLTPPDLLSRRNMDKLQIITSPKSKAAQARSQNAVASAPAPPSQADVPPEDTGKNVSTKVAEKVRPQAVIIPARRPVATEHDDIKSPRSPGRYTAWG